MGAFKPISEVEGGNLALFSNMCNKYESQNFTRHIIRILFHAGLFFSGQHLNAHLPGTWKLVPGM